MSKIKYDAGVDAYNFRCKHFIGDIEPINCKALLLKLNIITSYRTLSENFSGMCLKANGYKFLLINSDQSRGRQHFTIAHELYHLFIQEEFKIHICNTGSKAQTDINEIKADIFASTLLMPEIGIKSMIPKQELDNSSLSISTLLMLEHYFSVSHSAMIIRLEELGIINRTKREEFETLKITRIAKEYGYDSSIYSKGNEGLVIGDFGVKAKKLYDLSLISEGHYIELMSRIGIDLTSNSDES